MQAMDAAENGGGHKQNAKLKRKAYDTEADGDETTLSAAGVAASAAAASSSAVPALDVSALLSAAASSVPHNPSGSAAAPSSRAKKSKSDHASSPPQLPPPPQGSASALESESEEDDGQDAAMRTTGSAHDLLSFAQQPAGTNGSRPAAAASATPALTPAALQLQNQTQMLQLLQLMNNQGAGGQKAGGLSLTPQQLAQASQFHAAQQQKQAQDKLNSSAMAIKKESPHETNVVEAKKRLRARSTVPFNHEDWRVLGVWLARRCAPNILFWLPFYKKNGQRVRAEVGVESVMKVLAPKKKKKAALISAIAASKSKKGLDGSVVDEEELAAASNTPHVRSLFLHVRVVQRVDEKGFGFGQLRYICTDLGVSYRLGNTGHYWLGDHPNMFQLSCPNWNSSLSREELEQHLLRGSGKVFSSAAAFPTRVFIRGVLEGKGILAQCTLGSMTEEAAEQQTALAQEQAQAISGIAALKSGDAAAAAAAGASITAASSVLPMHLQLDAQTWTKEEELALALAMRDAVPFSFHPAPEVVSALPPLMHPNAMVHMPPAPTPTLPPATGVGDAVSALAFLSNHMGDHEGESKVPAGAYDSVHLSDSPVTSKEKRPVRFDRAGNKPTPVSDACLPFLQFSTVPSPSLPVSIVIPKPSFDEVVLATQAAGGSKQAGRVRTPRKAADQDRDKVIKAMQANAAVAVAFTEQNRLLNLYQSSFTPSAPVSSSIPLGTRLPTMLSTPVSAMSASSMSSGMGGGMSGSPTPGSSLADLVLPTSSSSAGAVPSLPLSFPPPPINFGSNTTATTTNMRLGSAHPHLIPPNSNTEASRAQRAYAAASIRQAAQEVEKMRQQQQQQKPHASPQPVQAQVHQSQLQPPPHQRAQTQPPPVPPPSLAALIPLTPLAPFTPMEALPASTLEMEFLLNGPPSSSLMRTPAPASGGASADDSSLLRGLDTPLTSHASHSSHPSLVFPSPFPLSNSAIHHVPLSSSSGFEDLLPGSPSPPLAWPHGMASPVPQAHPMSSPHAAAATTIKSVSSMQHGAANQRSSQSDVESAQQLLRRLETALRSRSDLQPIFLAAIQAAHAHAQQQQHAAAMAASLVDFAAAPPPPLQIVPLSSEQALSILRSVDDTVLRQWVSQTKLTEAQQQAWNATRKERQHIAEIDSYAKLKQSGSRATVHRM